jgi:hypothetical protein
MAKTPRTTERKCTYLVWRQVGEMFHVIQEIDLFRHPKTDDVPLVKSPQFGIFHWESAVLVASWIEERFDKDWCWWSSIDYSGI